MRVLAHVCVLHLCDYSVNFFTTHFLIMYHFSFFSISLSCFLFFFALSSFSSSIINLKLIIKINSVNIVSWQKLFIQWPHYHNCRQTIKRQLANLYLWRSCWASPGLHAFSAVASRTWAATSKPSWNGYCTLAQNVAIAYLQVSWTAHKYFGGHIIEQTLPSQQKLAGVNPKPLSMVYQLTVWDS